MTQDVFPPGADPTPLSQRRDGDIIRVASDSTPSAVAGAIAKQIRLNRNAAAQAIGVSAVNQMLKATIIANDYLIEDAVQILVQPSFTEVEVDGRKLTAIHLQIQPCKRALDGCPLV